ncbi:MAG: RluA family pseudouridine synthase [Oscillospiraceae bacterium]|jgi:23S rRNA pseudouridine955/2504/2580 synthase|nr:RluA family pseudouridine synthase [Oscillospiraceae bacterium]
MREFTVGPNDAGQRLDRFLGKAMPGLPFSLIQKAVREKDVKVDGRRAAAADRLREGQTVRAYLRGERAAPVGEARRWAAIPPPDVVYEDAHILALHKPPGLPVHPGDVYSDNTLIAQVQAYLYRAGQWNPEAENTFAPALAHRIDRNTGGLVLAAKTAEALRVLNEKFRGREIEKYYLCLVHGRPHPEAGTLKHFLTRDLAACRVDAARHPSRGAKTALTAYRVLDTRGDLSLVECRPLTGRTHQIRAQWAAAGHPLLGDGKYADNRLDRTAGFSHQALYAYKLTLAFTTPAGCLDSLRGKTFELDTVPFAVGSKIRMK